ncbi:MAG: hypothetical protein LBV04_04290 [Deferribacteraceae bacterium]|jgi:rRNA maturation protein Nop10|nr:hypothetical protein [Deferribacteraceae bacterium]
MNDFKNEKLFYEGKCTEADIDAAFEAGITYPHEIYYLAGEATRKKMIERLMATTDSHEANQLLTMLAMTGYANPEVQAAFIKLERNPRPWRSKLYVDPSSYAEYGGWSFTPEGEVYKLAYDICYPLEASTGLWEDTCLQCGEDTASIFTLDCTDPRLAHMGIGVVSNIICTECTIYETTFTKYTLDGNEVDIYGKETDEDLWTTDLVIGKAPKFTCNDRWSKQGSVGGLPGWINDANYEICPECGKKMKYYATVPLEGAGNFYLELCPDCQITAAFYQQT